MTQKDIDFIFNMLTEMRNDIKALMQFKNLVTGALILLSSLGVGGGFMLL